MNKVKAIVVTVLLSSALILFFLNGTIPRVISVLLSYPNYVIIVADEYYDNPVLQQFINYKKSQYIVEVKRISEIYMQYPVSNEVTSFLKVQNFEDIQSNYMKVYALWYDISSKTYRIFAYHSIGVLPNGKRYFSIVDPPSTPQEVYLYIEGKGANTIYLTYDGGKKLNVTVPDYPFCYTFWGKPKVTVDGNVYFYKTESYSVLSYVRSIPSLQYLLLIGNVSRVPSFDLRYIVGETVFTSVTDFPYCADDDLNPKFSVGRIPANNNAELELALTKIMNYKPYMSRKAMFVEGASLTIDQKIWDSCYADFKNSINQSLTYTFNNIHTYELVQPDITTLINQINSENDFLLFFCHGITDALGITSSDFLTTSNIYNDVRFKNYTVVSPSACLANDFSYVTGKRSIGEVFLFDTDSKVPIFIGASLPTHTSAATILSYFYYYLGNKKTVGDALTSAKLIPFCGSDYYIYEKLNWNVLGDPSLEVVTVAVPLHSYGWLDLKYFVNGTEGTLNALYTVTFPNGTSKTYSGTHVTVYYCPAGAYTITCMYKTLTQRNTVMINVNQGTKVVFNFVEEAKPKVGTIRVYSNIAVVVKVTGPVNVTRTTPFVLSDVPVGTYLLNATYDSVSKTHVIVLEEGQDVSYTFEFEVYQPPPFNVLSLMFQGLPYMFIGLAVVVLVKR